MKLSVYCCHNLPPKSNQRQESTNLENNFIEYHCFVHKWNDCWVPGCRSNKWCKSPYSPIDVVTKWDGEIPSDRKGSEPVFWEPHKEKAKVTQGHHLVGHDCVVYLSIALNLIGSAWVSLGLLTTWVMRFRLMVDPLQSVQRLKFCGVRTDLAHSYEG